MVNSQTVLLGGRWHNHRSCLNLLVLWSMSFRSLYYSFTRRNSMRPWTGLIQCVTINIGFLPLHPHLENVLEIVFFGSGIRLTSNEHVIL